MHDLAVLGGGPSGLLCALAAARDRSVALLLDERAAAPELQSPSVEAVPASLLALLGEFGITPRSVGVDRLCRERIAAWELAEPITISGNAVAHLVRPHLDAALLRRVLSTPTITTFHAQQEIDFADGCWSGEGWRARLLVDATGRRAVTATRKIRPPHPWIARLWMATETHPRHAPVVQTVALRDGYAYRLGTARHLTVGIVGPAYRHVRSFGDLGDVLSEAKAHWLIDGISALKCGGARVASVQWTTEDTHPPQALLRIGDAALARDALSSQGLATSLSDALCAVAALRTANGPALFRVRHRQQRRAHLRALIGYISSHRWSTSGVWRQYGEWLGAAPPVNRRAVVVRDTYLAMETLPTERVAREQLAR